MKQYMLQKIVVITFMVLVQEFSKRDKKYNNISTFIDVIFSVAGFWIEDCIMQYDSLKLTYNDACEVFNKVNLPRPHSKHICLRTPLGPLNCNAQYVFGNVQEQVWIDAKTGEARSSNPAFPDDLKKPLGEWP